MIFGINEQKEDVYIKSNFVLNKAKYTLDNTDEWYTTYDIVAEEVAHYREQFKGKIVLCNCDDPYASNFCYYFLKQFNVLQLKKLICTSYKGSKIDQIDNQLELNLIDSDGDPVLLNRGYVLSVSNGE